MSRALTILVLALSALAAPLRAEPLSFGEVNGIDRLADGATESCRDIPEGERVCALRRTHFGPLPINRSALFLDADGRARSLTFWFDRADHADVSQLLQGRYGAPKEQGGSTRWTGFDDGATVELGLKDRSTRVDFSFPQNASVKREQPIDRRAVWSVLAFVLIGLTAGALLYRARKRRAVPPPVPTMREVLERRMRDGHDLQF